MAPLVRRLREASVLQTFVHVTMFLEDPSYYRAFSTRRIPHADGLDSGRIVAMLLK